MSHDLSARHFAIALEIRAAHGVNVDGTCRGCRPPGAPWPCEHFWRAQQIVDQAAAELFAAPGVHPDWLDGTEGPQ